MPVTVTVTGDTKDAENALKRLTDAFGETAKAGEFLRAVASRIKATFAIAAIVEFTREAINAAAQLKGLSRETGLSIETLSSLREAANKTSAGFDGITLALGHFSQALGLAIRQGGASAQSFRDLIGVEGLAGVASGAKSMDETLLQAVQRLNALPSASDRARLGMELFGRSWRDALGALKNVNGKLEPGFITPEMVENSAEFKKAMNEVKDSFERIFIVLADRVVPKLKELANWMKGVTNASLGLNQGLISMAGNFAREFGRSLAKGIIDVGVLLGGAFIHLAEMISRKFDDMLVAGINKMIASWNAGGPAKVFGTINARATTSDTKGEADQQVKEMMEGAAILKQAIDDFFGKGIAAARALSQTGVGNPSRANLIAKGASGSVGTTSGLPGQGNVPLSVEAENMIRDVNKAFDEAIKGRRALLDKEQAEEEQKAAKEILDEGLYQDALLKIQQTFSKKRLDLLQQEVDAQREIDLAKIQGQRHLVESAPFQSENEKKAQSLVLLAKENELLKANVALMERRVADQNLTPEAHLSAEKQLQDLQQKLSENQADTIKTAASGTLGGEFKKQLTELKDQFGTVATQIAKTWKEVIGTAISSIASGISGLIQGTMTWSQALRQIGTSVLNVVIQGLVNMFAAMVLGENEVAAAKLAKQAATIPGELVSALASAIAEGGWAAAAIIAAAVAALGVGVAYAAGAFAEGGRPPLGQAVLVGEQGPELMVFDRPGTILPAGQTSSILSGIGSVGGTSSHPSGAGKEIHMHFYGDDKTAMINNIRNNPQVQHEIIDLVAQNHHRIN